MGVRPDCDRGCREYWENYWAGAVRESDGLLISASNELADYQKLAEKWQQTARMWEVIAKNWERAYLDKKGATDQYRDMLTRAVAFHDPSVSDE